MRLIYNMSNPFQSSSSSCQFNIKGGNKNDSLQTLNNKLDVALNLNANKKVKNKASNKNMKGGLPERYFKPNIERFDPNSLVNNNKMDSASKMLGGSSDFIPTVTSRGPVNYPNSQGTSLTGEQLFKTFNKTGTYIPNDQLNRASVLTDGILGYKLAGGRKR